MFQNNGKLGFKIQQSFEIQTAADFTLIKIQNFKLNIQISTQNLFHTLRITHDTLTR
jgi:hypothetical protein